MIVTLVLVGVLTGMMAASLGVGGGIVFVPVLVVAAATSQHVAEGTSSAVIIPSMIVAAAAHSRARRVDWRTVGLVSIGAILGGWLGAVWAIQLDGPTLQRGFALVMLVAAWRMLRRARTVSR